MKIFKYPVVVTDHQVVRMPEGAKILCVQMQGASPCVWAMVDEQQASENRDVYIFGTGHPLPDIPLTYIGTFQIHGGALVFHAFVAP